MERNTPKIAFYANWESVFVVLTRKARVAGTTKVSLIRLRLDFISTLSRAFRDTFLLYLPLIHKQPWRNPLSPLRRS